MQHLVLCPAASLAGPDPLACLPGQALDLPCHCWMTLGIMDCGWPWFLSPDLLCFSCLSISACVPGQWGHCPCLCCGHPVLLTRLLLQKWLPLNASSHEFLYSFRNRETCFLSLITAWKTSTENTDTHKCWTLKVGIHALLFSPCSSGCQHMRVEVYTEYRSFLGNVMNDLENAYPYCLIFFESIIVGYQSKYRGVVLCLSQWLPCLNCWQESGCPSAWETDSSSIQYYTSASPPRPVKMPWWQGANIDRRAISQPIGWLWPIHFFHLPTLDMWFMWPLWASQSINLDCYWDHCACLLEGQRLVCNWEKFLCEKPNISIVS